MIDFPQKNSKDLARTLIDFVMSSEEFSKEFNRFQKKIFQRIWQGIRLFFSMNSKGFGNEFNRFPHDLVRNFIDLQLDGIGL